MKSHNSALSTKEDRVAAALRENLRKRKAQQQQRRNAAPEKDREAT